MASTHQFQFIQAGHVAGRVGLTVDVRGTPSPLPRWLREAVAVTWPTLKPYTAAPWLLGVRVVGPAEAKAANTQFRQKDYVPDVLSFPLWEAGYAGDVLLCWPTLVAAAQAQGKPLKAHVQHLMVHAMLHIAGYDHLTPPEAKRMEAREIKLLAALGWPNPYLIP